MKSKYRSELIIDAKLKSHWDGMTEKAVETYAEYQGNLKKMWNKREITLSKRELDHLVQFQKFVFIHYPQFNKYLTNQPV